MKTGVISRERREDITQSNFNVGVFFTISGAVAFGIWRGSIAGGYFMFTILSFLSLIAVALSDLTEKN